MTWSVAIFSSREDLSTLSSSIDAIVAATPATETVIDVMVNGNRSLAEQALSHVQTVHPERAASSAMRIWHVPVPDKAHAWNQYLYHIWPCSTQTFFVDGYASVLPDALTQLSDTLTRHSRALAVSGVPTIGRSAKAIRELMLREGGIHGTLHALRGEVLEELRALGFRLPLGLYRVDGTLGAAICFALDPAKSEWDIGRICIDPKATWTFRTLTWRSVSDVRSHLKRINRQAQGILENLAVHQHLAVERKSPQSLPETAAELVMHWMKRFPQRARRTLLRNPLCLLAARNLRRSRDWSQTKIPPERIAKIRI